MDTHTMYPELPMTAGRLSISQQQSKENVVDLSNQPTELNTDKDLNNVEHIC